MLEQISICLIALYLRGLPRPVNLSRKRWVRVVSCLRTSASSVQDAPAALRSDRFWEEAMVLESNDLIDQSSSLLESERVITAVDSVYPKRWLERLREAAPPAVWIHGTMPTEPLIGIVGTREVASEVLDFARLVGQQAVLLNKSVVSGGALGCDRWGASGAIEAGGGVVEILPHGIDSYEEEDRCGLSACAPKDMFNTAAAMERNTLIYAAADHTVVVHAKFKQGGTWIGAVDATRRHLSPLIVRDDGSPASRALIGLGGAPITDASRLAEAMAHSPLQRGLFEIG